MPIFKAAQRSVPVLNGTLIVHPDSRTIYYEGAEWAESDLRCLSAHVDRLLAADLDDLGPCAYDLGLWLLEITDAHEVLLSGIPQCREQLRRYQAGCHEAIAVLDREGAAPHPVAS
jgi:hypothetical protein